MAYEVLDDVKAVKLGGVDKKTGKKNPTEIEGYYLRVEKRPNKFKDEPQNFYIFQTAEGDVGVYATGGIQREMKKAVIGRMTKLINTGRTLDTGKGNPMTVYQAFQDKSNTIEVSEAPEVSMEYGSLDAEDPVAELEEENFEEVLPARPVAPKVASSVPDADRRAKMQALLKGTRSAR